MNYPLTLDMAGSRFWLADNGDVVCCPVNPDGTPDLANTTEPEAMSPLAVTTLRAALVILTADRVNW